MSFVTTTLRDTIVAAAGDGGYVTVKATFASDTATNLILDAHSLSGFANGAKLDLLRAWWSFQQAIMILIIVTIVLLNLNQLELM
jgi:hypothetical protein